MNYPVVLSLLALLCSALAVDQFDQFDQFELIPGVGRVEEISYSSQDLPVGIRRIAPCVFEVEGDIEIQQLSGTTFLAKYSDGSIVEIEDSVCSRASSSSPEMRSSDGPRVEHGWQAWTTYYNADGINSFTGYFTVPEIPTQPTNIQTLYIFTGLQNINWVPEPNGPAPWGAFDIIQPVLQYYGGNHYSLRSWYVPLPGAAKTSTEMRVEAGDTIFGNMTALGNNTWLIESKSVMQGKSVNLTVTADVLAVQPWAYCTLEVYYVDNCTQYPNNNISFTDMLFVGPSGSLTANWKAHQGQELACSEKAYINSPSNVTITFGNS